MTPPLIMEPPLRDFYPKQTCTIFVGLHHISGYKGFHEYAKSRGLDISSRVWLDVMIDGAVLIGCGLSISTVFVCSTIAIMAAHKVNRLKKLLNLHPSVKGTLGHNSVEWTCKKRLLTYCIN